MSGERESVGNFLHLATLPAYLIKEAILIPHNALSSIREEHGPINRVVILGVEAVWTGSIITLTAYQVARGELDLAALTIASSYWASLMGSGALGAESLNSYEYSSRSDY